MFCLAHLTLELKSVLFRFSELSWPLLSSWNLLERMPWTYAPHHAATIFSAMHGLNPPCILSTTIRLEWRHQELVVVRSWGPSLNITIPLLTNCIFPVFSWRWEKKRKMLISFKYLLSLSSSAKKTNIKKCTNCKEIYKNVWKYDPTVFRCCY